MKQIFSKRGLAVILRIEMAIIASATILFFLGRNTVLALIVTLVLIRMLPDKWAHSLSKSKREVEIKKVKEEEKNDRNI